MNLKCPYCESTEIKIVRKEGYKVIDTLAQCLSCKYLFFINGEEEKK